MSCYNLNGSFPPISPSRLKRINDDMQSLHKFKVWLDLIALFGFSIPDISAIFYRKMSRFPFLVSCDFSPFLIKERGREIKQSRNGEISQLENKKVKMVVLRHVHVDTGFLLSPGGG